MCEMTFDTTAEELDIRDLIPTQRYEAIFAHIDDLAFGASFVLVHDQDPKPLCDRLEAEYPRQLFSTYREQGPFVWRIEIGRRDKTSWRLAGR